MFGNYIPFADADLELKTKHGIDKLAIMVKFMRIIHAKNSKAKTEFFRFQSFLVQQLQRGLTAEESMNFAQGIVNYINTEEGTNERLDSMKYLFELEFIN